MYEILVLGATFAAAGLARRYRQQCLVLEQRAEAGYEFFGAAKSTIYSDFKECHTVFCVKVVSVEKIENGFNCVTYGVDGFRSYQAKRVVDTRCNERISRSKTYDLLIEKEGEREVMRCPVPLNCSFAEARTIVKKTIEAFSEGQRLILMANEFDYCVKEGYPKWEKDIFYLPSKAYPNPDLAFKAGFETEVCE